MSEAIEDTGSLKSKKPHVLTLVLRFKDGLSPRSVLDMRDFRALFTEHFSALNPSLERFDIYRET